jgi:hypothetical protein
MPLQQSGPFQSRVLRRVVQWAQAWRTRAQVSWRSLKTTASWTAQILVYPIYAAFQAVRLINLRLQQAQAVDITRKATRQTQQAFNIDTGTAVAVELNPTCDTPLYQVLEFVRVSVLPALPGWQQTPILIRGDRWSSQGLLPGTNEDSFLATSSAITNAIPTMPQRSPGEIVPIGAIRAIASVIATRSLVLVTDRNTVLDILSPAQQQQLRQQITWEVARLLRLRRLQTAMIRLSDIPQPATTAHRLVRAFLRLMRWVAKTPVAIAANLFYEAEFYRLTAASDEIPQSSPIAIALAIPTISNQPTQLSNPLPEVGTNPTIFEGKIETLKPKQSSAITSHSDAIDTPATLVGYIQSPIEKLLRWLDRCVFWVENLVISIWRQLRP